MSIFEKEKNHMLEGVVVSENCKWEWEWQSHTDKLKFWKGWVNEWMSMGHNIPTRGRLFCHTLTSTSILKTYPIQQCNYKYKNTTLSKINIIKKKNKEIKHETLHLSVHALPPFIVL